MTKIFRESDIRQLTEFGTQCLSQCRFPNQQCFGKCNADWHLRQADRLRRETEATSDVQRGADHPHGVVPRKVDVL